MIPRYWERAGHDVRLTNFRAVARVACTGTRSRVKGGGHVRGQLIMVVSLVDGGVRTRRRPPRDSATHYEDQRTMHDLLTCPVVPVVRGGDRTSVSLPGLYAALAGDAVDSFPGLAAHQAQAWYQFLAQLGAIALHEGGREALPAEADEWRAVIAALTPECADAAWSLAVSDPTAPAFLQPPTTRIANFRECARTPDRLDVPVTAKNHDRKQAQAVDGAPHHWLYALLTLQTTQGYSGRGNPGIARMNGGLSSRAMVDRRPGPRWGPRVCRAIRMLLARREEVLRHAGDNLFRRRDGLALMWLRPWDEDTQINVGELDPYFIEVCRRIRLERGRDGRLRAVGMASKFTRVDAKALKGNLADPWVPVDLDPKKGAPALTVGAGGFDYRLAQRILLQGREFRSPLSMKELCGERGEDSEIHMAVMVRGQGKTEGLHERTIPLPHSIAEQLAVEPDPDDDDDRAPLAELSNVMVKWAGEARTALRRAVLVYLQGPENPDFQHKDADPVTARYDRAIDERFFEFLFDPQWTERGFEAAREAWQKKLRRQAERLAREVWASAAAPGARREKARAASEAVFYGGLRKRLPDAFADGHDSQEDIV